MATSKKAVPAAGILVERDFVYCGLRPVVGGALAHCVRIIEPEGLGIPRNFKSARKTRYAIGGIYRGAAFNLTQVSGLDVARYVGMLDDKFGTSRCHILEWEAEDARVREEEALLKLEKDQVRRSQISRCVAPLHDVYDKLRSQGRHTECSALERAVSLALRTGRI